MNGRAWPCCVKHGTERLDEHERSMAKYADSDVGPTGSTRPTPESTGTRTTEPDPDAVIRLINAATREWVRHILGECDPADCVGDHSPPWKPSEGR